LLLGFACTTPEKENSNDQPVSSPDSYLMKLVYYKTPYVAEYRFKFDENLLTLERDLNVSFGPTELGTLKGVRAD